MTTIDLIYDVDCPNVDAARDQLLRALAAAGLAPAFREWDRADGATPDALRAYGSPTILIDGEDVAPAPAMEGTCACRVYAGGRAPSFESIRAALERRGRGPG